MKLFAFVISVACVLNAALAFDDEKIQLVESKLLDYVEENLGQVPMMRGNTQHATCYDRFSSIIADITGRARELSEQCVATADHNKQGALDSLELIRSEINKEVQRIHDSLYACAQNGEGLGYFECLLSLVDEDKAILDSIAQRSRKAMEQHGTILTAIDSNELGCLQAVVDQAKGQTDTTFSTLKQCLRSEILVDSWVVPIPN